MIKGLLGLPYAVPDGLVATRRKMYSTPDSRLSNFELSDLTGSSGCTMRPPTAAVVANAKKGFASAGGIIATGRHWMTSLVRNCFCGG